MSLESIIEDIIKNATEEANLIIREAKKETIEIIEEAEQEARLLYDEILNKEKAIYEKERRRLIVEANLKAKKDLLKAKQEFLAKVFDELKSYIKPGGYKKMQIYTDKTQEVSADPNFYIQRIRLELEPEISKILFR